MALTPLKPSIHNQADLTTPGAILLVSCYELGHQPLNLAFPMSILGNAGYKPVAVDTAIDRLTDDAIRAARLVAISVPMHTALRLGTQVAEQVRLLNPDAAICFYGLYAWLNAEYILGHHGDYVIGGEFEQPLLELVKAIEAGELRPVDGVSTPKTRVAPALERIDFPMPDRSMLPAGDSYAWLIKDGENVPAGYTEATRGCHHTCLHCPVVPIYNGRFFAVPRGVVIEDIRQQVLGGAGHITFGDPDALNGPTHLLRIMRAVHEEFPRVTFDITTRIEHILLHQEIMPELARLGCVFIVSAVESVSGLVLRKIDKGHTKADVIEALRVCDDAGIAIRPSLLPFTPWTTLSDYLDLLAFIDEQGIIDHVDPVHLSIRLLVPPGSALLDQPHAHEWVGPLDEASFTYTWEHADPRLDELQREVAAIAEDSEQSGQEHAETFEAIRIAAYAVAGLEVPPLKGQPAARMPPPRLTESWFC